MFTDEEMKEMYFEWIKDETNNYKLTGEEAGIKLALKFLVESDPLDMFTDRVVASESIADMTITYATGDNTQKGMPIKVMKWIEPYYKVGVPCK